MKLPIGIQTFSEIRERNMLYVDKTRHIYDVVSSGKYFFLSRPRRFGKSLLLSTMKEMYEGNRTLFEGLWIENNWNWDKQFPVLHFKFSSQGVQTLGLEGALLNMLEEEATRLGVILTKEKFDLQFKELIIKASAAGKVVILVDEYDKPIVDNLDDIPRATANQRLMKVFYSVLKDCDPYIELVFITGVSRFAKTSIFSDLNNLLNLTMHPKAMTLLGITSEEVDSYFTPAIHAIAADENLSEQELKAQIQSWYNGYSWNGKDKVYNPFSLLNYFGAKQFNNFWFESGTPTFLVQLMRDQHYYNIERVEVADSALDNFDFEHLNPTTILFQTGYLTIIEQNATGIYTLDYPNKEVKVSLEEHLLNGFAHDRLQTGKVRAFNISKAFQKGDIEQVINIINATFSSIPNQLWQQKNEAFYHALIHLTFSLVGVYVQSEVNSAKGRLDAKIETLNATYILEFKLGQSAKSAINQIEEKGYFNAYSDMKKKRIGVGINFSKTEKQVEDWLVQEF